MTRTSAAVSGLMLLLVLLAVTGAAVQREAPPFQIAAVKAMLFYAETATFSADLFGPSAPTLQNVSTGQGQAIATLVIVEITGPPDTYMPSRKIAFTATAGRRLLLNKTLGVGRPGDDGKFHAAFWLYDTACTPVVLKARITGQTPQYPVQKTLNFRCGD
jgi:hypothetical protein